MNRKYIYLGLSLYTIMLSVPHGLSMYQNNQGPVKIILFLIIPLVLINVLYFLLAYLSTKVINWYERRRVKDYSLYEWLGSSSLPINLYNALSEIKDIDPRDFYTNYQTAKSQIQKHIKSINELKGYKIFLQVQVESPKYTSLQGVIQAMFLAVIIPAFISVININDLSSKIVNYNYLIFIFFFLMLLFFISYMSKEINKRKILLKLVNDCIEDMQGND